MEPTPAIPSRYLIVGAVVALAVSFAAGRYTAPAKYVQDTKTQSQRDASKQVNTDTDQHVQTVVQQVKKPDGTVITKTITTKDTDRKQQLNKDMTTVRSTDSKTEITKTGSPVTISALAGLDVTNLNGGLIYGLSVSRPLIGPVCVGIWGLTNKTGGVSVGLQF